MIYLSIKVMQIYFCITYFTIEKVKDMKSRLTKLDVFSIVLGSIIGWGSFMLPGTKF